MWGGGPWGRDLTGPVGLCNINSLWNYTTARVWGKGGGGPGTLFGGVPRIGQMKQKRDLPCTPPSFLQGEPQSQWHPSLCSQMAPLPVFKLIRPQMMSLSDTTSCHWADLGMPDVRVCMAGRAQETLGAEQGRGW